MDLEQLSGNLWTCCYRHHHPLLSPAIPPHRNAYNGIKLPCCRWVNCISISANLAWLIRSGNLDWWLSNERQPSSIPATNHLPEMNRNILCNCRNAAAPGPVYYFNLCQAKNRPAEHSVAPHSKTQTPAIDFPEAIRSAFYLLSLLRDDQWGYWSS